MTTPAPVAPAFGLSSGPSGADGQASASNVLGTGAFNFKGSSSEGNSATIWGQIVPFIALVGVAWALTR